MQEIQYRIRVRNLVRVFVLTFLVTCVIPAEAQKIYAVGKGPGSTNFSFYNTSPESPDGNTIAYIKYIGEPNGDPDDEPAPAELWVCNRNLKEHRKLTNIRAAAAHNGVEAQWVDDTRIALFDSGIVRLISIPTGRDLLTKKIKANGLGHHPFNNKILYHLYKRDGERAAGIYELDCNTQRSRLVIATEKCYSAKLPDFLQPADIVPAFEWRSLHSQYSPDGKKIAFRLDVGNSDKSQLLGICNADGSELRVMIKALHFFWYDNESIVGHLQVEKNGEKPASVEKRLTLTRWDLYGNVVQEMMAPKGNHLAVSPDKKQFASESFYQTNPVVLSLYTVGAPDATNIIDRFDPYNITWKRRFHVNPAFSRDGKRVYFCKPLNEKYNGTFFYEIK